MIVLKATQDKVLSVLQSVAGIVERRHTLPILANVLIRKTGSSVQLTWVRDGRRQTKTVSRSTVTVPSSWLIQRSATIPPRTWTA